MSRTLVVGWFSFDQMGATAGDLLARDIVRGWLEDAGHRVDIAVAPPFSGGVDWREVDSHAYSHVVFVCGPFGNGPPVDELLERFSGVPLIGVDLTMLEPLEAWNPFQLLLERDSSRAVRPDLAFLAEPDPVPVVGLVLIGKQPEYGDRDQNQAAADLLRRLLGRRAAAVVPIDTRLDENATGLRTPSEIESLIGRMDVVATTRLHGLVLALKQGVPAVVIDPVAGGGKIMRQAEVIGWERAFRVDEVSDAILDHAFDACLAGEAGDRARACADRAREHLSDVRGRFLAEVG
ncbi:MAG: polysaccharide pyruvyl transferase family protein [Actinobacteria bacterium]|nr:polysaccharide pyruvyl transferase family protein [Actinomycetota bacterium]